jgi:ribonucleoside-diphosphate reductase beta chain
MATLLELSQQGDVGTITDESKLSKVKLMDPQQLYQLWERQPWSAHAIDLEQDKVDWSERVTRSEKDQLAYNLSAFFIGEERVATQFSGLVRAYADVQEEAFLTTQQVDEARHMQFFDRWYREVPGYDDTSITSRLQLARRDVSDSFLELFDGVLVDSGKRLIDDPSDIEAKVDFVTTYHMVIEGTLALTGQHFMLMTYERENLMPGFQEGFGNIARDEHRHVAYGTWFLQQKCADPALRARVQETLNELLPIAAGVLVPKGFQLGDDYEFFGYSSQEQAEFAYSALSRRLKVIGVPLAPSGEQPAAASL